MTINALLKLTKIQCHIVNTIENKKNPSKLLLQQLYTN